MIRFYFCATFNQEVKKMKKIYFAIAACAIFAFAACNNATETGNTDSANADSVAAPAPEPAPAPADSTATADSTAKPAAPAEETPKH